MENLEKINLWENKEWRKYWGVDDNDELEDDSSEEM